MKKQMLSFVFIWQHKWKFSIGVLVGLCAIVFGGNWLLNIYLGPPIDGEKIVFSDNKYPLLQTKIANILNQEDPICNVQPSELAIALTDLDDDGINEVIAFCTNRGYYGVMGNATLIYRQCKNQLKEIPCWCMTDGHLVKSHDKTNGYHNIISYGIYRDHHYDGCGTIAWIPASRYEYVATKSVSIRERNLFINDL